MRYTENILKHCFSGGQYSNCHPPGNAAHGFMVVLLHGGGTIAPEVYRVVNNKNDVNIHIVILK